MVRDAHGTAPCPAPATLIVYADNASRDAVVTLDLEGELRDATATCVGASAASYAVSFECAGRGFVRCGTISGLRPGAWVHRVTTTVRDSAPQHQARVDVLLADGGGSNVLTWTVYARTFSVGAAEEEALHGALDAAAAFADATGETTLVTFDRDAFPGAADPRTIDLSRRLCAADARHAGICFAGSDVVVDGLDERGEVGSVELAVGIRAAQVLRVFGARNVFRGLVLRGSTGDGLSAQADTVALTGPSGGANSLEHCVIVGPTRGDSVSVENGAGGDGQTNRIVDSELRDAAGVGIKVTTGAQATLRRSCLHDNRNGGALVTAGGRLTARENLVQRNAPGNAPAGLAAGSSGDHDQDTELVTSANVVRFNGARGLSVTDGATAVFAYDYVADNQFVGARVEAVTAGDAPRASFEGVALVCNHNEGLSGTCEPAVDATGVPCLSDSDCCGRGAGCCVNDVGCTSPVRCAVRAPQGFGAVVAGCDGCEAPTVDFGRGGAPGSNAFTLNANPYPNTLGVNLLHDVRALELMARGNQWERCGNGGACDVAAVLAGDVRATDTAVVDAGEAVGARAGAPVATAVSIGRPRAGDLVRVFGRGFNAIDGAACARATVPVAACSADDSRVVRQNRSRYGNLVQLTMGGETTAVDVMAVTPTMLAFRMPVDCFAPALLKVSRRDATDVRRATVIDLCDPGGCQGQFGGEPCDDANVCTVEDSCSADGRCIPGPALECGGPCMRCDPIAGCVPRDAASACDDGNVCTVGDHCSGSADVCVPGAPRVCAGACQSGACDPLAGCEPAPATTACDDGNACTLVDRCRGDADVCVGSEARSCVSQCLTGRCDPARGCVPRIITAVCQDGDACTAGDHCRGDADVCVGGAPSRCDDDDPCTVDTCDAAIGCSHEPLVRWEAVGCRLERLRGWIATSSAIAGASRRNLDKAVTRMMARLEAARAAEDRRDAKRLKSRMTSLRNATRHFLKRVDHGRGIPSVLATDMRPVAFELVTLVEGLRAAMLAGPT